MSALTALSTIGQIKPLSASVTASVQNKTPNALTALSFLKNYGSESSIHIGINTSPLFDIWTASFLKNKEGVWFTNGGVYPIMALAGGNNTQKTGKAVKDASVILYRFKNSIILYGDQESTLDIERFARMVDDLFGIPGYFKEHIENKRFFYMPSSEGVDGTMMHNRIKEIHDGIIALKSSKDKEEQELYKSMLVETPFWSEKNNAYVTMYSPILFICDSISETKFDKLAFKQFEEGDMDSGGKKRTRDMEIGNLRRVLVEDTCYLGPRVGIMSYWLAQTADKFSIDGKPVEKDTTFIRQNKKLSAPKALMKLPHLGVELLKGQVLKHPDGSPLFPSKETGTLLDAKLNPDLVEYSTSIFRNKMGSSTTSSVGFIGSQRSGIKDGLSMYYILRSAGYYGLTGNQTRHQCALLPDQLIMRTTINDLLDNNPKLERAIGICYHLWFVQSFWSNLPESFRITPEELYTLVKEQGYDWDEMLDTIDFWHDNHDMIKKPTLVLYELLEIAVNKKKPYWKK